MSEEASPTVEREVAVLLATVASRARWTTARMDELVLPAVGARIPFEDDDPE